jgi:hypothetical protein
MNGGAYFMLEMHSAAQAEYDRSAALLLLLEF